MTEFAGRFKQLREQKQLSQQEVAKRLVLQTDEVQKWENGETLPDTLTMMKLSEMFGVSLDYLIRGEETAEIVYSEKDARQEFTDGDVHRIAYKYMLMKMRLTYGYVMLPIIFIAALIILLVGIKYNLPLIWGVGIFFFIFFFVFVFLVIYKHKIFKKEETVLREKYGNELISRATLKLLFRLDRPRYDDKKDK